MHTITVSDEVWNALVNKAQVGESPDDLLKRELIESRKFFTNKDELNQFIYIYDHKLTVSYFEWHESWKLPPRENIDNIKEIIDNAVEFIIKATASYFERSFDEYSEVAEEALHKRKILKHTSRIVTEYYFEHQQ